MAKKSLLTSIDIASLINAMKLVFPTREEVGKIVDERFKFLPTKDEFFARIDKLSGEYKKIDEAETLHAGTMSDHADKIENHDERISALENRKASSPAPISFPHL
ncbi:MAG: hypothetical protein AAB457_04035 [Patescibacteria group bacterium]